MIDTHCHLYAEQFDEDRDLVIARAKEAGVDTFLMPNIDLSSLDGMYALTAEYPETCLPMMGLHPCSVNADYKKTLDKLYKELQSKPFIGIGEIGLDYYWDITYKTQQLDAFNIQLQWAKELRLPVAIHTRNSFEDAFKAVDKAKTDELTGVFHCFSGSLEDTQKVTAVEFYMGIGGVATFKNGGLDKVLPHTGLNWIVLETDAPYLAPVPHRGKRNEPAYIPLVAARAAELTGKTTEEIAEITTSNASRLFKLFA